MSVVKWLKKFLLKHILKITAIIAFILAAIGASQLCIYWYHQPKMPDKVKMLKGR